ncbi:rhamnan synthesis F family protein [Mycobacterium simiae]|nr:rhamnan synthesis F family protein [Mycobacterium simiae]
MRNETERAAYRIAERYREDGDAIGFICETHLELPAQPPSGPRTLILFAHFDAQGIVDPYVVYYLKALHGLGATIVFVSGAPNLTPGSVDAIRDYCAGIYTRETLSLDFGSWHLAWCIMRQHGWSLNQFDRFVIANDSVFGPLFPLGEMWGTFRGADMYGASESTQQQPHLQSYFLAWDLNRRTRPFLNDFWDDFQYVVDKLLLIRQYEVGISARARDSGLSLKPFASAAAVKETYARQGHPRSKILSRKRGINNTIYYWDGLIEHLRFPFLKASLPRHNTPWQDSIAELRDFIEQHTDYPYGLIQSNVDRLGLGAASWVRPSDTILRIRSWLEAHSV